MSRKMKEFVFVAPPRLGWRASQPHMAEIHCGQEFVFRVRAKTPTDAHNRLMRDDPVWVGEVVFLPGLTKPVSADAPLRGKLVSQKWIAHHRWEELHA